MEHCGPGGMGWRRPGQVQAFWQRGEGVSKQGIHFHHCCHHYTAADSTSVFAMLVLVTHLALD